MTSTLVKSPQPDVRPTDVDVAARPGLTVERVWHELEKASFAVISYVTPAGKPRSSGVVYAASGRRLYVVVAPTGWKARHIADGAEVAVTVPVRRGGVLALLAPIPPAAISFHARVTVHPADSVRVELLSPSLAKLLPPGKEHGCLLELMPEGCFLTYGVGVSLLTMKNDPAAAQARVPVA